MHLTAGSRLVMSGQRIQRDRRLWTADDAPPVLRIDGRSVVWSPWTEAPCIRRRTACQVRHNRGWNWVAWGRVNPAPGEQFTDVRPCARGVREVAVPAWPIIRLVAYDCPACGHRTTIDLAGGGWRELAPAGAEQLELFPTP